MTPKKLFLFIVVGVVVAVVFFFVSKEIALTVAIVLSMLNKQSKSETLQEVKKQTKNKTLAELVDIANKEVIE